MTGANGDKMLGQLQLSEQKLAELNGDLIQLAELECTFLMDILDQ